MPERTDKNKARIVKTEPTEEGRTLVSTFSQNAAKEGAITLKSGANMLTNEAPTLTARMQAAADEEGVSLEEIRARFYGMFS